MWKEKEYLELLESKGVDTVCFMGSGYHFEEYRVGQEFYFPYAYYAIDANKDTITIDELKIAFSSYDMSDRYRLIQKYKFRKNQLFAGKYRIEHCLVKNLRTGGIIHLKDSGIDRFYWLLMAEPI